MAASRTYSRRTVLQQGAAAFAIGVQGLARGALGQEVKPRGAAAHRFALGSREIIILSDGHLEVPAASLAGNIPEPELRSFLAARTLGPERVNFHINVALVKTGSDYVLIDAGSGGTWEPTAGKLTDSLEAAGIKPQEIGRIVLTHAHPDHIWGLVDELDDSLRFPRAEYVVPARELDFWTMGEAQRLTGPVEGITAGARRVFGRIAARTTRIKPGDEVAPGMVAIDAAGHTPGHISVLVTSGPAKLLVTSDAVQNTHVSFSHPEWQPRMDMDGERAAQSRRRLLDMAAADKMAVLSYHIPFPGLGRVQRVGSAFSWVPEG